jgi:DUF4097 and DUF4098 domain-containing protein YvlB
MSFMMKKTVVLAGVAAMILSLPAYGNLNKSVKIADGAQSAGASSVNGSITVGDKATVTGSLSTVNGAIRIGEGSSIEDATTVNGSLRISNNVKSEDLETVNGGIKIGEQVVVDGEVTAVNGSISLREGSSVASHLSNVNGDIDLTGSTVGRNVTTVNGDVSVMEGAVIKGDLIVENPNSSRSQKSKKPTIIIGPGSRVEGVIRLEHKVELYISESAKVGGVEGVMSMDDAERFSGSRP